MKIKNTFMQGTVSVALLLGLAACSSGVNPKRLQAPASAPSQTDPSIITPVNTEAPPPSASPTSTPDPIQGLACTLTTSGSSADRNVDSCPRGYSCSGAAAPSWKGTCNALVDGVDYCSSDDACVAHHGTGWTCSHDTGACVTPASTIPDPIQGSACTLTSSGSSTDHNSNSCPNGYNCKGAVAPKWEGTCDAWVDGVDYCSSDDACVAHHGTGWTCSDDTRDCVAP